jgi:hypothetical protein
MALERKNISIPISGGVNQAEDGYLLKPPSLDVINGYYQKDGSIKKRGAYQFLQAGFSSKATPFVFGDTLHVLDKDTITKFGDPTGSPSTVSLDTLAETIPVEVTDVPLSTDGVIETVSASDGQGRVMVAWTQPVSPSPDTTVNKATHLYIAEYKESNLDTPSAGPFRVTSSSSPVDIEEITLTYGGGFFVLSGVLRFSGALVTSLVASASQALTFVTVRASCNHYDIFTNPNTGATWWLVQELNDTSNATPALRTWGDTVGVRGDIVSNAFSFSSSVLGSVGSSDNYVGDKMLGIHVKGSTIWCAVASTRHQNIYVYTTNLTWGSKSSDYLVHTFADDQPDWTGGWNSFAAATGLINPSYPYYVPDNVTTSYISSNDRLGRIAVCTNEAGDGVYVFWTAPVLSSWSTTGDHFLPGLDPNGAGDISVSSCFGVAWRTVSDSFVVGSSLGAAPCSYLHSKPFRYDSQVYVGLSMSLETQLNLPYSFFNSSSSTDSNNVYPGESPQRSYNDTNFPNMAAREAAWKMGQLCVVDGASAVPVAQWGADLLAGPSWGLFDRSYVGTKGADEAPVMSTRRPMEVANLSNGWLIPGLYLSRADHVIYERAGDDSGLSEEIEGRRMKATLAFVKYGASARASATVIGEEVYFSNGWMGVYDGFYIREAAPNFIPFPVLPVEVTSSASLNSFFDKDAAVQVSWVVVDHKNRLLRGSLSPVRLLSHTDGGSPPVRETNFKVYDQPPSIARAGGRTRFEVWFDGWDSSETTISRYNLFDPSKISTSGPFRFTVTDPTRGWGDVLAPGGSELLPEPVGGCTYLTSNSNRVWYVEPEDVGRVRFSKDFSVLGRVEFNRNLYVDIPDGSRPVAVTTLDEQVVIFTDTSIFLLVGNLPNNSGGGANFYLQKVAFEDGCSNRYSVFPSRVGVFFESDRGINLLTRGYEVVFVGSAVEDSAFGGNSVTGVSYLPQEDIYLFTTSNEILVCHEAGNEFRWTRWAFEHDADIVASCAWGNYHVILDSEGTLHYMDMSVVTNVQLTVTTPWMYFGDLEGFQRIRDINLVGRNESLSPAGSAAIQIGYDFADAFSETVYYEYGVSTAAKPLRIRFKPGIQKTSSFRLRYTEVGETVGQAVILEADITLAGIAVEAGVKSLGNKVARNTPTTPS